MWSGRELRPCESVVDVEAELGGDLHLVADGLEDLADELLVLVGAVDLGGVEEGDAGVEGGGDDVSSLVQIRQAHAAEADVGHFQVGCAQVTLVHGCSFRVGVSERRDLAGHASGIVKPAATA